VNFHYTLQCRSLLVLPTSQVNVVIEDPNKPVICVQKRIFKSHTIYAEGLLLMDFLFLCHCVCDNFWACYWADCPKACLSLVENGSNVSEEEQVSGSRGENAKVQVCTNWFSQIKLIWAGIKMIYWQYVGPTIDANWQSRHKETLRMNSMMIKMLDEARKVWGVS
jgi:hypothetical protein